VTFGLNLSSELGPSTLGETVPTIGLMYFLSDKAALRLTAGLNPVEAITLALEKRPITDPTSYAALLDHAYPLIAGFGGVFLLMLFLDWLFDDRDIKWLRPLEAFATRIGQLNRLSVVLTLILLVVMAETLADNPGSVLMSGAIGMVLYLLVNAAGDYFDSKLDETGDGEVDAEDVQVAHNNRGPSQLVKATGKAGFIMFLYLEMIDAAFSFDGVIGAFAITPDPILIALGLGFIGAMFVRSLTVYLVRKGTLAKYVYLEHGAHCAIGALAVILLCGIGFHVNEIVTGLVGVGFIGAAFVASVLRNKRLAKNGSAEKSNNGSIADIESDTDKLPVISIAEVK